MNRMLTAVFTALLLLALNACNHSTANAEQAPAVVENVSTDGIGTELTVAANSDNDKAAPAAAPRTLADYEKSLAHRCETDSDCTIKNVGSCCGYTPQCVHKDVQTFPERVKALCEQEGRSSICGFQEPAGCSCVDNQCRNADTSGI